MTWTAGASNLNVLLALILIGRLLFLKLHSAYRIFCIYLCVDLVATLAGWIANTSGVIWIDYWVQWSVFQCIELVLYIAIVFVLLRAVLRNLPGILKLSTRLLYGITIFALLLSVFTLNLGDAASPYDGLTKFIFSLDRVVCTSTLVILLSMLAFLFWFPVELSRNLAVFYIGYVVYFSSKTGLLLAGFLSSNPDFLLAMGTSIIIIANVCLLYWIFFLSPAGEAVPIRLGHIWKRSDQPRFLDQLSTINATLMRAGSRK